MSELKEQERSLEEKKDLDQQELENEDYEEDYDDYDDYLDDELNETDMWDNVTGGKIVIKGNALLSYELTLWQYRFHQAIQQTSSTNCT